jgi:hypothetical protein
MAATTIKAILDRFQAVLAAAPLSLVQAQQAFSHDRQPNAQIQDTFWIENGGLVNARSASNKQEVRVHRLTVYVAKPASFAGLAQMEAMLELGDTMYRYLIADGLTQGWNVSTGGGERVTNPKKTELVIASYPFLVDFDFSVSIS